MKLKKFNFNSVISTNNTAINIIRNSKNLFGMVIAEKQKKGRGQYGKKWISYKGNLFVSIFFNIDRINLSLTKITRLNCLLTKKLLSFYYKKNIAIKPPNDLMIDNKKICGILQEKVIKDDKIFLIVGIGINLIKNPVINKYPTTNLYEVTRKKIDKKNVIKRLKSLYENNISKLYKNNQINLSNI